MVIGLSIQMEGPKASEYEDDAYEALQSLTVADLVNSAADNIGSVADLSTEESVLLDIIGSAIMAKLAKKYAKDDNIPGMFCRVSI